MEHAGGSEADDAGDGREPTTAASRLTDDLLLLILSRLPARSLHRFRCVSRHWRDLICHPNHRGKMAQSLAGFFYIGWNNDYSNVDTSSEKSLRFITSSACPRSPGGKAVAPLIDPLALSSFPPGYHDLLHRIECSNGLLLITSWAPSVAYAFKYAVCNPATDEWRPVPDPPDRGVGCVTARLVFDYEGASSSPHSYRIFQFQSGGLMSVRSPAVWIYLSETGAWTHRKCGWGNGAGAALRDDTSTVFFQGKLLMCPKEEEDIVSVDLHGDTWSGSPKPRHPRDDGFLGGPPPGFIGLSQGRLRFLNTPEYDHTRMCVWERDDNDSGLWVLKRSIDLCYVFGGWDYCRAGLKCRVIGIHPDCDMVYFLEGSNSRLVSCAMDGDEGSTICELGARHYMPYVPYVPVFSRSLI